MVEVIRSDTLLAPDDLPLPFYFIFFPSNFRKLVHFSQDLFFEAFQVFFHCRKEVGHTCAKNTNGEQACVHTPVDRNRRHRYTTLCDNRRKVKICRP